MKVNIGVSNRHVHLTKEHADILFGCELTKLRDLVQKGQYACNELVIIKTEKSEIPNVRVLGPTRSYTQDLTRTSRGRVATPKAWDKLGISGRANDSELF